MVTDNEYAYIGFVTRHIIKSETLLTSFELQKEKEPHSLIRREINDLTF